jgi:hypothetical protein
LIFTAISSARGDAVDGNSFRLLKMIRIVKLMRILRASRIISRWQVGSTAAATAATPLPPPPPPHCRCAAAAVRCCTADVPSPPAAMAPCLRAVFDGAVRCPLR